MVSCRPASFTAATAPQVTKAAPAAATTISQNPPATENPFSARN